MIFVESCSFQLSYLHGGNIINNDKNLVTLCCATRIFKLKRIKLSKRQSYKGTVLFS